MSERITVKDLRAVAARLDRMAGFDPDVPAWTRKNGRNVAQVGRYVIDGAYGGWELHQIMSESGGIRVVLGHGHRPARDLYDRIQAYMEGLEDAKRYPRRLQSCAHVPQPPCHG